MALLIENKEFKKLFGEVAKSRGFQSIHGYWYVESVECILTLELLKSNFSNLYYLNIRTFIHGIFGKNYIKDKTLSKGFGNITSRPPGKYHPFFDLDLAMESQVRKEGIESLFDEYLLPYSNQSLSRKGISELPDEDKRCIPLSVKEALNLE